MRGLSFGGSRCELSNGHLLNRGRGSIVVAPVRQTYAEHLGVAGSTTRVGDTDRNKTPLLFLRSSKHDNAHSYLSIHSFNEYLWCVYSVQGTVTGAGNASVDRTDKDLAPLECPFSQGVGESE